MGEDEDVDEDEDEGWDEDEDEEDDEDEDDSDDEDSHDGAGNDSILITTAAGLYEIAEASDIRQLYLAFILNTPSVKLSHSLNREGLRHLFHAEPMLFRLGCQCSGSDYFTIPKIGIVTAMKTMLDYSRHNSSNSSNTSFANCVCDNCRIVAPIISALCDKAGVDSCKEKEIYFQRALPAVWQYMHSFVINEDTCMIEPMNPLDDKQCEHTDQIKVHLTIPTADLSVRHTPSGLNNILRDRIRRKVQFEYQDIILQDYLEVSTEKAHFISHTEEELDCAIGALSGTLEFTSDEFSSGVSYLSAYIFLSIPLFISDHFHLFMDNKYISCALLCVM